MREVMYDAIAPKHDFISSHLHLINRLKLAPPASPRLTKHALPAAEKSRIHSASYRR
jgi:hypothetical protein